MVSLIKYSLLSVIFFKVAGSLFGQSPFIKESAMPINLKGDFSTGFVVSYSSSDTVYFLNKFSSSERKRQLYFFSNNKLDSISFAKSKELKKFQSERVQSFVVRSNGLTILTNAKIYEFRKSASKWKVSFVLPNKHKFYTLHSLGEKLLLEVCYPFHKEDSEHQSLWGEYDPLNGKIRTFTPSIDNSKFGCFINSWVSVYNGMVAHASTLDYKIHLYNNSFQLIDSICFNDDIVSEITTQDVNQFDLDSKDAISAFMQYDEKTFSRIRKVMLLDSTNLLVIVGLKDTSGNNEMRVRLDLWQKKSGQWSLSKSTTGDGTYTRGANYSDNLPCFAGLYQNMQSLVVLNKSIYRVFCPFVPSVRTESYDRKKDMENYFIDHPIVTYGIQKFEFDLD